LESGQNSKAIASLIAARVVYAVNWLNVGAIFVLMGPDLGSGVGGLGTLTSAFYLGIGLMQLPGGVIAARWGPKKTVVLGVFMSSLSALATAAAPSIPVAAVLRFLVGWGMAFVFAPGVVIVARLLKGGRTGTGVGLFNSAYDVGGLLGISGWVVLATATGWRPSLALGGGLGVLTGLLIMFLVPPDTPAEDFRVDPRLLRRLVADRELILLGLATLGLSIGNIVTSSFMGYYAVKTFGVSPAVGGAVQGLVVAVPIVTAFLGGRVYDRSDRPRRLMALALVGGSFALAAGAYPSIWTAIACSALVGVVSGLGYTVAFAGAKDLNRSGERYDGLAVAWVNGISLTGSFVTPLIYSYLVVSASYMVAWLGCSIISFGFLIPLMMMTKRFRA
jgi:MFS transporter, ACS family, glucarate transporter